jgi:hemolysin-activating ACP:hemolysin acyltransferase
MLQPLTASTTAVPAAPRADLRVFRPNSPYVALGLAVNHLMTKPAFASLPFGECSGGLVGQINRKHYYFVVDTKNQVQGFVGWAVPTKDKAEAWVEGHGGVPDEDSTHGDCIVLNAWTGSTLEVNRFLLDEVRKIGQGKDTVYFKRYYSDGSVRPGRLRVNDFVAQHVQRQATLTRPNRETGEAP